MLALNTILQGRYRIVGQLGQGGMGTVYEAIDERLDTTVALKESHFDDERLRKQFEREARLLARLRHPAMTRVIDHFTENDGQYLVMDFVAGEDLWEMLQKRGGAFPAEEVLIWADQLLDALTYLHKQDPPVIHRDIKPQNLKLSDTGQIILLDFGLAKGFAGQISRVTTSGSIFGYTPNYAPLEQIQGAGTESRSDLYSLAATLYHLLTGTIPPDVLTRLTATTEGQPDPLRPAHEVNPKVTEDVASVLTHGMAIARSHRFNDASEMRSRLRDLRKFEDRTVTETEPEMLPPTVMRAPGVQEEAEQQPEPEPIRSALPRTVASPPAAEPVSAEQSVKTVKAEAGGRDNLTGAQMLQLEYWTGFGNYLKQNSWLNSPTPLPQHWMAFAVGGEHEMLSATMHVLDRKIGVSLTLSGSNAKARFHLLYQEIDEIESDIGTTLNWKERPNEKESHIISYQDADPNDRLDWPNQFQWLCKRLESFHNAFAPRIADLSVSSDDLPDESGPSEIIDEGYLSDVKERPTVAVRNLSAWLLLGIFIFLVTVMVLMAVYKVF